MLPGPADTPKPSRKERTRDERRSQQKDSGVPSLSSLHPPDADRSQGMRHDQGVQHEPQVQSLSRRLVPAVPGGLGSQAETWVLQESAHLSPSDLVAAAAQLQVIIWGPSSCQQARL